MAGFAGRLFGSILGLAICLSPVTAQTYASLPSAGSAATPRGDAKPLLAWVEFCQRVPTECEVNPAEPATVELTPRTWALIGSVNRRVNTTIVPATDADHWGVADRWDIPTDGFGDCEDFQLLKRKLLVESGLPRRAMRMTVVIDERQEGHAVLTIRTDRGEFVLDNKTNAVLPWFETGYTFVKRESQTAIGWVSLGGATSPSATANR